MSSWVILSLPGYNQATPWEIKKHWAKLVNSLQITYKEKHKKDKFHAYSSSDITFRHNICSFKLKWMSKPAGPEIQWFSDAHWSGI